MSVSSICGILLVAAVVFAAEQHPKPTLPGACPEFNGMQSLDVSKLTGDWFAISGFKKGIEKEAARCVKKSMKPQPDGKVEVTISFTKSDNQQKTKTATSTPIQGKPGHFTLSKDADDGSITKTATIIDTDYTDHMVSVVCGSDGKNHGYMLFVYGRGKTLTPEKIAMIKDHLKTIDNIQDELTPIEQNC